jgi:hypothetical protein
MDDNFERLAVQNRLIEPRSIKQKSCPLGSFFRIRQCEDQLLSSVPMTAPRRVTGSIMHINMKAANMAAIALKYRV